MTELPNVRVRWWPPPAWAWLFLAPALFIGVQELRRGGRTRVDVAGAGLVARLIDAPAPEGVRFAGAPAPSASLEASVDRVKAAALDLPRVLVFGLDGAASSEVAAAAVGPALERLVAQTTRASPVVVVVGPTVPDGAPEAVRVALVEARRRWRTSTCRSSTRLICVDLQSHLHDESAMLQALHAASQQAAARLDAYRSTTQRGR